MPGACRTTIKRLIMNDNHQGQGQSEERTQLAPHRAPRDQQQDMTRSMPSSAGWGYDEAESSSFDMRQLISIFKRRQRLILATFTLITVLGVVSTLLSQKVYEAQARVIVDTAKAPQSSGEFTVVDAMTGLAGARTLETQIEVFKSPAVVQGARKRLTTNARKAVGEYSQVDVQQVGQTDIMEVTVRSRNPHAASAYCNALVAAYMAEDENTQHSGLRRASSFVRDKVEDMRKRRDATARRLRDYKQKNNTVDLTAETTAQITQLGTVVADREKAQTERQAAIAQLAELKSQASKLSPTQITGKTLAPGANVTAKKAELASLELELLRLKQEYTDTAPEVGTVKTRISQVQSELSRAAQTEVTGSQIAANPLLASAQQKIADLQGEIWASEARVNALGRSEGELRAVSRQLPAREYEMGSLMSQLQTLEQTYQMLNQKYEQLRISENATAASTRLLASASAPLTPISPRTGRNLLTTLVAALVAAIALAALVDRMDDHIHSEEDAESATHLPIIAHVPFLTGANGASLLEGGTKGSTALLESYRMLRTNIAFASIDEPIRSLVVTSSLPNEGKSTTSLDLAVVMALDGKSVIVLDADLRRPSINSLLQLSNAIGFSSVVTGEKTIDEALQNTSVKNLRVMTSGPVPPNPPELLNSRVGRQTIMELAGMADFLIIDTPPALTMADAQIVASIADATVLVVSAQGSNKKEATRTTELLSQTGTKLLGVVLNKITREWGAAYSYYGGHNVYYGTQSTDLKLADNNDDASDTNAQLTKTDARSREKAGQNGANH